MLKRQSLARRWRSSERTRNWARARSDWRMDSFRLRVGLVAGSAAEAVGTAPSAPELIRSSILMICIGGGEAGGPEYPMSAKVRCTG